MDSTPGAVGDDLLGRIVDGFRIDAILGSGGMGRVYKAFDTSLHREVAMKVVAPFLLSTEFDLRFQREARALSAVNHANVAHVYSFGRFEGRPYYVMEYIDGSSLASIVDAGKTLSGLRCLHYLIEAANGLQAAFEKGIIHRDIKPSNLMIGSGDHLKIVDFGLARLTADDMSLTPAATAIGTPRYMSPEQAVGQKADHRSDIYSLGCTFHHLFAGAPPFDSDDPVAILMQHVNAPVPQLKERNPRVPAAVCAVIEKMMQKRPEDRYQTYEELIADLSRVQAGAAPALPVSMTVPTRPVPQPDRRVQPWLIILGAALLLIVATVISGRRSPAKPKVGTPAAASEKEGAPDRPQAPPSSGYQPSFDPKMLVGRALEAKTLANMKKISTAVEVWKAQQETLPPTLDPIAERYELHPQELIDAWKRTIRYEPDERMGYRLTSAGPDGSFGNDDDIVLENGFFVKGEPDITVPTLQR